MIYKLQAFQLIYNKSEDSSRAISNMYKLGGETQQMYKLGDQTQPNQFWREGILKSCT
jgi:hypothetical protein